MAPAKTATVDEALDQNSALIYSPKAPLAGRFSPTGPAPPKGAPPPDPNLIRKDDRAVWSFVPTGFKVDAPEVLVYLHGHNYFVTAQRDATGKVVARVPDWLLKKAGANLAAARAVARGPAGHFYQFDSMSSTRAHKPLMLLPEDGHHTHDPQLDKTGQPVLDAKGNPVWDGFWCKESIVGTLASSTGLGDVTDNCLQRLFGLPTVPPGKNYLTKELHLADIKRLYLTGHSGGGVPLAKALVSDFALATPTTACFLDATYGDSRAAVRKFCETWSAKSHLGNKKDDSCLVIVYNPKSGTEAWKTEIVKDLKNKKKTTFAVNEITHTKAGGLTAVQSALKSSPIVVIHTDTDHEDIPPTFAALLLENP